MKLNLKTFIDEYNYIKIERYLLKKKWQNDGIYNQFFTIWHRPEEIYFDYELILPTISAVADFESIVNKFISNLSNYYDKSQDFVIDELLDLSLDRVKFSIKGPSTKNGKIPLNDGLNLIENTREMIIASLLSVGKKRKNYIGSRPDDVNEIIKQIEMGQTEEGSYIINLYVPKEYYEDGNPTLDPDESYTRKALSNLQVASEILVEKSNEYIISNDITIFDTTVELGVSSNLCKAISEISMNGENDVEMEIAFNNGIENELEVNKIEIKKEVIPTINLVKNHFRKDLNIDDYVLIGHVTKLKQEVEEDDGSITLSTIIEGKLRKVSLILDADDYIIAQEAHRNKALLRCVGTLTKHERRNYLVNITSILLTDENEEDV